LLINTHHIQKGCTKKAHLFAMYFLSASGHAALNGFLKSFVAQSLALASLSKALKSELETKAFNSLHLSAFKLMTGD
jgi:hypothetical protein